MDNKTPGHRRTTPDELTMPRIILVRKRGRWQVEVTNDASAVSRSLLRKLDANLSPLASPSWLQCEAFIELLNFDELLLTERRVQREQEIELRELAAALKVPLPRRK